MFYRFITHAGGNELLPNEGNVVPLLVLPFQNAKKLAWFVPPTQKLQAKNVFCERVCV